MKFALLFLLILLPVLAQATGPSRNSCSYYLTVENDYHCGTDGYPLKFGYRMCEKYLTAQPIMRPSVQKWFPKIRYCLQNYLEDYRWDIQNCDELQRNAINSHIGCYVQTGFCELDFFDQAEILQVTSLDFLNPDIIGLSYRVKKACERKNLLETPPDLI